MPRTVAIHNRGDLFGLTQEMAAIVTISPGSQQGIMMSIDSACATIYVVSSERVLGFGTHARTVEKFGSCAVLLLKASA